MAGRKNKVIEQNDAHRWVISYADFITLLFAFFVVMYAISSVNVSKYKSLSQGMHSAFSKKNIDKAKKSTDFENNDINDMVAKGSTKDAFDALSLALSKLEDSNYKINRQEGWIELDIKAGALFDSGSADLRPVALIKLMKIADIIKNVPYPVAIEGYTDNQPIETPQFPSNWELSAARAASVARILNSYGIISNRLSVTGFGDQHFKADNTTEWGRRQNRRVNLIIAKDRSVSRLSNPGINSQQNSPILMRGVGQ